METRILDYTPLAISHLSLGCMGISEFYGETNDAESVRTVYRAIKLL